MPDEPRNENAPQDTPTTDAPSSTPVEEPTSSESPEPSVTDATPVSDTSDGASTSEEPAASPSPFGGESSTEPTSTPNLFGSGNGQPALEAPNTPALPASTGGKKKGLIVGGIIALALGVLGGGGASAYFLWYQNPEKVVFDALISASKAESLDLASTLTLKDDDSEYDIKFNLKANRELEIEADLDAGIKSADTDFNLKGGFVSDKDGNLYVKVNEVPSLLEQILGAQNAEIYTVYFGTLIEKIDNQWIKISSDDLKDVSQEYGDQQKCLTDASKKLSADKSASDELVELFKKNKFIIVGEGLGTKDVNGVTSLGYVLDFDADKATSFVKGIADTKYGKALKECDDTIDFSSFDGSDLSSDSTDKPQTQVWVSQFGHELTQINIEGKNEAGDGKIVLTPTFNSDVKVTVPTDVTTLKELTDEFESTLNSMYAAQ